MATTMKNQQEILEKLGIRELNPMQKEALVSIKSKKDTILLSPTGTGKTLAFLLPVIEELDATLEEVQVLILVPSRELAIQIEQVTREMGSGFKANAVYGGRAFSKDKIELNHPPAILIGTPGRVADHLRRETFSAENIKILVLDEFDKSLEVGFEAEMKEIISFLPQLKKRILTSATQNIDIPAFAGLQDPQTINYLQEAVAGLHTEIVVAPKRDKLETLLKLLQSTGNEPGIIFCNFKDSIQEVSDFLQRNGMPHACFSGGMEQKDRERALIKFRNGTHRLIIATDLAARGIDIPEIKFIIHYQLPHRKEEFTHRNGRTARMHGEGTAYVLQYEKESLPEYVTPDSYTKKVESKVQTPEPKQIKWTTLFISGGRKDKISKGDIAGLFLKQGNLAKEELGVIELKQDCAFVSVPPSKAEKLVRELNNTRLKKKKVRISRV
ncbi:DEAD/DEAH box helicase [Zunongwangia sp. F260]|uniref:DEAD/DEAH box helicase n=1 Tax=Autumnicola lenta TaxID=3075593 RepID=A0ABU3CMN3_9FLAO|nr:DEAD/DEAH box helicase [Zunongwangia sp. F260]MDT0647617.1 DEAD/DEAH box helicase [Zunongwangia sp. F260]